ncbi:DUF748 domain-containing protein [Fimbriiglobus ruber]|uniref:AsmA-like C-terminal domain-containing protein n=1 Tax=Fimbriiglobus ruber TaxID=1908690 RepID=A0A225DAY0_9BACT|nr:DUF748 domain-containing protein [Fimbriiglobus ruber]OWK34456.1 hypothetical protein FRUB_10427 [Fimbriiglobus ruber]
MAEQPTPPIKPRRRGRRILVGLLLVVVALLVLAWFAPSIVAGTGLRAVVIARATAGLKGTVTVSEASFGWLSPVELRDVRIADADGNPVLVAARVTSSKLLIELAHDQTDLGTFTVEQPALTLVCDRSTTNLETLVAEYLKDDGRAPSPERVAVRLAVVQGKITLHETGREGDRVLDAVDATVTIPRPRTDPVALELKATTPDPTPGNPASTLSADCGFGPSSGVRMKAERFDLATLEPIVRRFANDSTLAGRLTADLAIGWGADDAGHPRAAVAGRATVAGLDCGGPWLGADRVRLQSLDLPCKLKYNAGELQVEQANLTCDAGTASISGSVNVDESADKLLARSGLKVTGDVDLAKLAAVLPRLLHIKEGTVLSEGRVQLALGSKPGKDGTDWEGTVHATSIKGERAGKKLVWDQPLSLKFAGRLQADGTPEFDVFECQADFIGMAARGSPGRFVAAANIYLDRLAARLSDFVDLGGVNLAGTAEVNVQNLPRDGGGFNATGVVKLTRFTFTDAAGRGLSEPQLTLSARAAGAITADGHGVKIDSGDLTVAAAADTVAITLLEPVADARTARTGKVSARLAGDLARWRGRAAGWVALPATWEMIGTGTVTATATLTATEATINRATVDLANARFLGAGINLNERALKLTSDATWDRGTGAVVLKNVGLTADTGTFSAERFDLTPTAAGYAAKGSGLLTANMARVQRTLGLQTDPSGSDVIDGLAKGTAGVDTAGGTIHFNADLTVDRFAYGPPAKPVWTEPWVKVTAAGEFDGAGDALRFQSVKVSRDGFAADVKGTLSHLATTQDVTLDGTLAYDLSKLDAQLKAYLGKGSQIAGKDTRPFKLTGSLAGGASTLTAQVGQPAAAKSSALAQMNGSAAVNWQALNAYGFDVGPAELKAGIDHGAVTLNPIEATFGGGKVRLEPRLNLASATYDLSFAKGRVIDHARLTPAACADAIGYALPAIANVAQADGLISFDLDQSQIPLTSPDRGTLQGKLTLHQATVSAGPLATEIATVFGTKLDGLTLANEQVVGIQLRDGRVYHDNLALTIGATTLRTSGSVGVDGTMSLVIETPIPPHLLDRIPGNNPQIRAGLAKQTIKVPVTGTIHRPQLDRRAFEAGVEQIARSAAKDASKGVASDLLKKGEDKLKGELMKKFGNLPFGPQPPAEQGK